MKKYLLFISIIACCGLISCSEDGDSELQISDQIIGIWQLDRIEITGPDCATYYGADVPSSYMTDSVGCVRPVALTGSTKYCINLEFSANGQGAALNSLTFGNGAEDAPITYTINESTNEIEYCFENNSFCSEYTFENGRLISVSSSREGCDVTFVLEKI